jgi:hypothetical protein
MRLRESNGHQDVGRMSPRSKKSKPDLATSFAELVRRLGRTDLEEAEESPERSKQEKPKGATPRRPKRKR